MILVFSCGLVKRWFTYDILINFTVILAVYGRRLWMRIYVGYNITDKILTFWTK